MSVVNGSPVDATNTNAAYLSKLTDGDTAGKIGFKNTDAISGAGINNIQRYVNEMADASGVSGEGDATRKQYGSTNFVADGDSRKEAIGKLDVQMKITDDLAITNQDDIVILDARVEQNEIDIQAIEDDYGVANGLATLDGTAKIPVAQIPDAALGGPRFVGTWNANTNTPTLSDGGATTSPDQGDYYRVSVAGTTTIDGENDWGQGDWIVFNGSAWDKIDNSESVSSVNSQTGTVTLDADDIAESATRFWSVKDNRSATTDPAATDDETDSYSIGSFWFNSSSGTLFVCQDATATSAIWVIATGGGGGGGLSVFHTQTYEATKAADISRGNDSTFGGTTSALQGSLSDNETTPINGDRSLRFTHVSTSQNDWFYTDEDAITIYPKQQGRLAKVTIWTNWTGADGDNVFYLEDDSNTKLSSDSWTIKSGLNKHEFFFTAPSGAVSLRAGIQVITANDTETLDIDDIEFDLNTHSEEAIKDVEEARYDVFAGNGSTNNKIPYFTNERENTFNEIATIENDSTDGWSITFKRKATVHIMFYYNAGGAMDGGLSLNSNQLTTSISSIDGDDRLCSATSAGANFKAVAQYSGEVEAGDVIRPHTDGQSASNNKYGISVLAEALSDHVVTPARSNLFDWTDYTPTTQGLGTVTINHARYRRVGDSAEFELKITTGTPTADEIQVGLPSGLVIGEGYSLDYVGETQNNVTNTRQYSALATTGDTFFNFGQRSSTTADFFTANNGDAVFGSGATFSVIATVKIEGWSSEAQFLAAIPKPLTAYIKDEKTSGTVSGTLTAATWNTRDLNTLYGDSEIVELSSNQFTLQPGKYRLKASVPAYVVNGHKARLQNVTDSSTQEGGIGTSEYTSSTNSVTTRSVINCSIDITSPKTFEIQHRISTSSGASDGGALTSSGINEVYTEVEITKIN